MCFIFFSVVCLAVSSINLLFAVIRGHQFFSSSNTNNKTGSWDHEAKSPHQAITTVESGYISQNSCSKTSPKTGSTTSANDLRDSGLGQSKSSSLPTMGKPLQNPTIYHSQNLLAQSILAQSATMRPIKGHKFGSVITLKERSLLGVANSVALCGAPRACPGETEESVSTKEKALMSLLLLLGVVLLVVSRLMGLLSCTLVVGPWIFMGACKCNDGIATPFVINHSKIIMSTIC